MDELEIERRLTSVEDLARSNRDRVEKVEEAQKNITELVKSVASIAQKQTDMEGDMKEIKADVKMLATKPGKRWDSIVEKALLTVVAGLVTFALIKLGIG